MSKFHLDEKDFLIPKESEQKQKTDKKIEKKESEKKEIKEDIKKKNNNKEIDLAKIFSQDIEKGANNPRTSFIVSPFQLEVLKIVAYHKRIEAGVSGLLREAVNEYLTKIKKDPVVNKRIIEDIERLI